MPPPLDTAWQTSIGPQPHQDIQAYLVGLGARQHMPPPRSLPVESGISLVIEDKCPICYCPYTDPYVYPCGHAACKECWAQWQAHQADGPLTCPTCRTGIPPGDGEDPLGVVQAQRLQAATPNYEAFSKALFNAAEVLLDYQISNATGVAKLQPYDTVLPDITDLTPCINYLSSGKIPIMPSMTIDWDIAGSLEDVNNFVAVVATIMGSAWSATNEQRKQWLTLIEVWAYAMGSPCEPEETNSNNLYREINMSFQVAISDWDSTHNVYVYGDELAGADLIDDTEPEHGSFMLLCHFIAWRQYQRQVERILRRLPDPEKPSDLHGLSDDEMTNGRASYEAIFGESE